jgi:hypothetical protein
MDAKPWLMRSSLAERSMAEETVPRMVERGLRLP